MSFGGSGLRTPGRRDDLGELHSAEPRQDLPPEQLRVVDRVRIGLVPLRQRPLAGRDGCATPATDLGRLRWVSTDAGFAADTARIRDRSSTVGTCPQRKSDRLSCWTLEDPAGSRTTSRLDFASLHDRLRIAKPTGRERSSSRVRAVHRPAEDVGDVLCDRAERLGPLGHGLGQLVRERCEQADVPVEVMAQSRSWLAHQSGQSGIGNGISRRLKLLRRSTADLLQRDEVSRLLILHAPGHPAVDARSPVACLSRRLHSERHGTAGCGQRLIDGPGISDLSVRQNLGCVANRATLRRAVP